LQNRGRGETKRLAEKVVTCPITASRSREKNEMTGREESGDRERARREEQEKKENFFNKSMCTGACVLGHLENAKWKIKETC
jgi:hypothetical protein